MEFGSIVRLVAACVVVFSCAAGASLLLRAGAPVALVSLSLCDSAAASTRSRARGGSRSQAQRRVCKRNSSRLRGFSGIADQRRAEEQRSTGSTATRKHLSDNTQRTRTTRGGERSSGAGGRRRRRRGCGCGLSRNEPLSGSPSHSADTPCSGMRHCRPFWTLDLWENGGLSRNRRRRISALFPGSVPLALRSSLSPGVPVCRSSEVDESADRAAAEAAVATHAEGTSSQSTRRRRAAATHSQGLITTQRSALLCGRFEQTSPHVAATAART